jgi:hypothetical protein
MLPLDPVERELQVRKQALRDAQKGADTHDDDNDDDDDDNGSMSTPDGQLVRHMDTFTLFTTHYYV